MMEPRYSVYIRSDMRHCEASEIEVGRFPCYSEARRLKGELVQAGQRCVIRATGQTGGSD